MQVFVTLNDQKRKIKLRLTFYIIIKESVGAS